LELIVVDDGSRDNTRAIAEGVAARDGRLQVLSSAEGAGAYAARNLGLQAARGAFVTLHDGDDWSHPETLARQMGFLAARPDCVGVLSGQYRCGGDLAPRRWTGEGRLMHESAASLLAPRAVLADLLGGWDRVKVSADSEILRRLRHLFGEDAVGVLAAPLCLKREHDANATAPGGSTEAPLGM